MDRTRFDALTRLLGAEGSRRTALGAVLGAALLGRSLETHAKPNKKAKRRRRNRNRPPQPCFGTKSCRFPSDGQDFEDCDFAGDSLGDCNGCNFRDADLGGADLSEGSYQGASFREANLRGANFEDADVSGVSFRFACLVDATLLGANTDGAHFGGAILCNTTLSDGSVDDSGCDKATACCPTGADVECVKDADCRAEETCVDGVCTLPNTICAVDPDACMSGVNAQICGDFGGETGFCFCYPTTESGSRCLNINTETNPACAGQTCDDSSDCDAGEFCGVLSSAAGVCCAAKLCGRECPELVPVARRNEREVSPPHA